MWASGLEHNSATSFARGKWGPIQEGVLSLEEEPLNSTDIRLCDLSSSHLRLPCRMGPYVLRRLIGRGATAQVFEAERRGRCGVAAPVAIKRLLPHLCHERKFLNMFIREAVVYSHLHHPNILQLQDFNEVDGQLYIVTDIVDGCDLETLIQSARSSEKPIPASVVIEILRQLLCGLSFAHRIRGPNGQPLNVLHRDIKPSNVLISRHGEVKLGDFGLAKATSCSYQTLTHRHVKGTLRYMSPEHVRLEEVMQASDLFSVGVVLYEMLTLEPLIPPGTCMEQIIRTIAHEPRSAILASLQGDRIPFGMMVEMALQPDLIRRYGSADEFLDDVHALRPFLAPGPTVAAFVNSHWPQLKEIREGIDHQYSEEVGLLAS